jgi:hypothetical protein
MFRGRDREAMAISRDRIARAALAESARLVASHIAGVGRLRQAGTGVVWEEAAIG